MSLFTLAWILLFIQTQMNNCPTQAFNRFFTTKKIKALICLLTASSLSSFGQETNKHTAVFNQQWPKTLASIEVTAPDGAHPIGSGFLIITTNSHVALVTAKHVVFEDNGNGTLIQNLGYRLNSRSGNSVLMPDEHATKTTGSAWVRSTNQDIACRLIAWGDDADFTPIPLTQFLPSAQVESGAPVFIIGFPMGLRSEKYASPIVRRGNVARKDDTTILVDGFVFPGNSGGPVVYEPTTQIGEGLVTPILQGSWLIGLVSSEITYTEPAFSLQTKRPRIIFEENAGLCNIIPADAIRELLDSPEFQQVDQRKQLP